MRWRHGLALQAAPPAAWGPGRGREAWCPRPPLLQCSRARLRLKFLPITLAVYVYIWKYELAVYKYTRKNLHGNLVQKESPALKTMESRLECQSGSDFLCTATKSYKEQEILPLAE